MPVSAFERESRIEVLAAFLASAFAASASAQAPCLGDLNADRVVDGIDLGVLLSQWGGAGSADLNGSGTVDGDDFAIFLPTWTEPAIPE